jgi:hypothetical protein
MSIQNPERKEIAILNLYYLLEIFKTGSFNEQILRDFDYWISRLDQFEEPLLVSYF